jgi:hypothetical protein
VPLLCLRQSASVICLLFVISCHFTSFHVISCHFTSFHVVSCHIMFYHVRSSYFMCHGTFAAFNKVGWEGGRTEAQICPRLSSTASLSCCLSITYCKTAANVTALGNICQAICRTNSYIMIIFK